MKYIKDQENLNGKRILLRLDLNVPIKNGIITDQTRIDKILPIINFLIKKKSKILVISHVGRPKGKFKKDLSLKPICENLEKKINQKVSLFKGSILELKRDNLFQDSKEQIIFLENIRFYEEEEKNDISFSKHLSKLADIFVNDAFSCSHRAHASVNKITEFLH
jgi:phosphoglycerate kinase